MCISKRETPTDGLIKYTCHQTNKLTTSMLRSKSRNCYFFRWTRFSQPFMKFNVSKHTRNCALSSTSSTHSTSAQRICFTPTIKLSPTTGSFSPYGGRSFVTLWGQILTATGTPVHAHGVYGDDISELPFIQRRILWFAFFRYN